MRRAFSFILDCALALIALAFTGEVVAEPQKVVIPAHLTYCLSTHPLNPSAYSLPEVREALFQTLYKRLEQAALNAGLVSMGVAYVDAVVLGPDIPETTDQSGPGLPPKMVVSVLVRQCAVVGSRGSPELPKDGVLEVPARTMYASLCLPTQIDSCKRAIEALVRKDNHASADAVLSIVWRTRQALTDTDTADNLVSSLVDSKLRVLKDNQTSLTPPKDLFVYAAELVH